MYYCQFVYWLSPIIQPAWQILITSRCGSKSNLLYQSQCKYFVLLDILQTHLITTKNVQAAT